MSHNPYRIPTGVESGIGKYIYEFAQLERCLRGIICELGETSAPAGEILTSQLNFRGLTNCFGAIVQEYVPSQELRDDANKLLQDIEKINEFRNQLVHSLWLPDENNRVFAIREKQIVNKKGYASQHERFKKRDLNSKCKEVKELTHRLFDLYRRIKIDKSKL